MRHKYRHLLKSGLLFMYENTGNVCKFTFTLKHYIQDVYLIHEATKSFPIILSAHLLYML